MGFLNGYLWAWILLVTWPLTASPVLVDHQKKSFDLSQKKRMKVVSAFVGADEIVLELLKDEPQRILALSPLARDARYSSIAEEAKRWPVFGEELESLIKLKPDLVIAARYTRLEWLRMLQQAKIESFVLGNFSSLEDIMGNILIIGQLVAKEEAAQAVVARMRAQLGQLAKSCPLRGKKVLNYNAEAQLLGQGTTFNDMMQRLGAENIGSSLGVKGWAVVSQEKLLTTKADYIVVAGEIQEKKKILAKLSGEMPWKHLDAVKQGRMILIPAAQLSSVSQHVLQAMETACAQL